MYNMITVPNISGDSSIAIANDSSIAFWFSWLSINSREPGATIYIQLQISQVENYRKCVSALILTFLEIGMGKFLLIFQKRQAESDTVRAII